MENFIFCGACGLFGMINEISDNKGNCMRCGEDHWLEWEDFNNPDLVQYIRDIAGHFVCDVQDIKDDFELMVKNYSGEKALAFLKELDEYLTVNDGQNILCSGSIYHERIKNIIKCAKK